MRRTHYLHAVVALALSACGAATPSATGLFHPGDNGAPPTPQVEATPRQFVAAPTAASDVAVTLTPQTYDASSPCAAQQATQPFADVKSPCLDAWIELQPTTVPGNDLMTGSPVPKTAAVAEGVDPATATTEANAFYEAAMLQWFALKDNNRYLLSALDTTVYTSYDKILHELVQPGTTAVAVPACNLPISIRVVSAAGGVDGYITSLGWPQPSALAIVANYAPCPGITFRYGNGAEHSGFGQNVTGAAVITGHAQEVAPFGKIFVMDGYALCGEPGVKSVCNLG